MQFNDFCDATLNMNSGFLHFISGYLLVFKPTLKRELVPKVSGKIVTPV